MLSRNDDTTDSMGALHSRHKPRSLEALSTMRWVLSAVTGRRVGRVCCRQRKPSTPCSTLGSGQRQSRTNGYGKQSQVSDCCCRLYAGSKEKCRKTNPSSSPSIQAENKGKPLFSLQIIAAPIPPKFWMDLFSRGKV